MHETLAKTISQLFPGLENPSLVTYVIAGLGIVIFSIAGHYITRKIFLQALVFAASRSKNEFDDALIQHRVFGWAAHITPAIISYMLAPAMPLFQEWIQRFSLSYMSVMAIFALNSFLNATSDYYNTLEISQRRPIKGYMQVAKILVISLGIIFVITNLMDKSPWKFLSGLGAMSAILLLVFKDSILGLVAGIQLSSNKMVKIGDWIEMPKYGADGNIIEVALTTVKVQNWDKTITTIPTYSLVSDSFKNWRGMSESGGRRIKRSIYIDMNTIRFCTVEDIDKYKKLVPLKKYLEKKIPEIDLSNNSIAKEDLIPPNLRRLTNIGTFRAYVESYLRQNPKIHMGMTFLIRQLEPGPHGLPLEIYVFTNDNAWVNYEGIQADIFDHLLAILPEFDLRVFQSPSGNDIRGGIRNLESLLQTKTS